MEQEELNKIIADNLAKYRKASNFTQLELAEKLNYSDKSISKWEQGNGVPDIFILERLAKLYGISVNDFLIAHTEGKHSFRHWLNKINKHLIIAMASGLCWLIAVIVFVGLKIGMPTESRTWLTFIFTIPVMCIVVLVLSSVWKFTSLQILSVSTLVWTLLLAIYLTVVAVQPKAENVWMIFFVGAVLQGLIALWFIFRMRTNKKK